MTRRLSVLRLLRAVVIAGALLWTLGPILVAAVTSVSTQSEITASPAVWFPHHPTLRAYRALLPTGAGGGGADSEAHQLGSAMLTSLVVSLETTAVTLVLSVLAGYAFARLDFRGRKVVFVAVVSTLVLPVFALVVPLFRIMATLQLINTNPGLILIYVSAIAPLGIWMFYSYVKDVPVGPQEAALVDGCTRFQALVKIVLPQMRPGIAALTTIVFLASWSQFLIPLLFAQSPSLKPVTVLITEFVGKYNTNYALIAAAGLIALLPPALLALSQSRQIRGMLSGGDL
ncbi:MAG TPA: carbohydrate ABC transporter permease [Streptosporangiaceae bacterium]|nr:carbohydrate ABC transporter permease [Streptosporangiaceae bacterium]